MTADHFAIAEQLLGSPLDIAGDAGGGKKFAFGPCPGAHLHTTKPGHRDFRLVLDPSGEEMPRGACLHSSCAAAVDAFMSAFYKAIRSAERAANGGKLPKRPQPVDRPAPAKKPEKPEFSRELAYHIAAQCPKIINEDFLRRISPVEIPADRKLWAELLIDALFRPGERVLIFDNMASQGQFIRVAGKGNYRLGRNAGQQAHPCPALPTQGENGVWFLNCPVTGQWLPNPNNIDPRTRQPKLGRRHAECCTAFRYAVIESDSVSPAVWLNILALLEDAIAAVYTSGSKSVHTLLYLGELQTPQEFNAHRSKLLQRLVPIGADPAALTPVRLTRLPGALRLSKTGKDGSPAIQKLLYLNPNPKPHKPLHTHPFLRP